MFANADRPNAWVGANVNGASAASADVEVRGFANYGAAYMVAALAVGMTEADVKRTVTRGRRMSAAARKAVSERMKKYWAARRAGKKR